MCPLPNPVVALQGTACFVDSSRASESHRKHSVRLINSTVHFYNELCKRFLSCHLCFISCTSVRHSSTVYSGQECSTQRRAAPSQAPVRETMLRHSRHLRPSRRPSSISCLLVDQLFIHGKISGLSQFLSQVVPAGRQGIAFQALNI